MSTVIIDMVEAGAIALCTHKGMRWEFLKESWRWEQRAQARAVLAAAKAAREGCYRHTAETVESDLFEGGPSP